MIDLFSDTHTLPSDGMRRAMAEAEVGDEQLGEDPTTNRLQERVAELLGTEAALFLPTGSMCTKVAIAALTRPGDAVVCDHRAHFFRLEGGGPAALSGIVFDPIVTTDGRFTADQVRERMVAGNVYQPRTSVVAIEQTHNLAGGTVWPIDLYEAVCRVAREHKAAVFVDGARLLNAVAATGVAADRWGGVVDAVWIDFSKGLGGPGGAVLAGTADVIGRANRFKYMFGGAMRQSGMLAAAALYGLDNNLERLSEDHANARTLADGLVELGLEITPPESNMVFAHPPEGMTAAALADALAAAGVRVSPLGDRIRMVTHLGIGPGDIDTALAAVRKALAGS